MTPRALNMDPDALATVRGFHAAMERFETVPDGAAAEAALREVRALLPAQRAASRIIGIDVEGGAE